MVFEAVPLDSFAAQFGSETELSSVALGGKVTSVSDEFFAEAFHLLKVEPSPSLKGQFGPKGALFSGWETRRHNSDYDWCIIKLGTAGAISGFDIDTSHFHGNEAPEASVQALFLPEGHASPSQNDSRWSELVPRVPLGPNARHLFKVKQNAIYNYVKLNIYPDGGVARFRVYGIVQPVFPDSDELIDLAHVFSGGRVVFTSDQHFGVGSNLLLPGRGKDMGDGWETKRSRMKGHKDWAIIKLGTEGLLEHTEIDTAHFMGNYPESCELHALFSVNVVPSATEEANWTLILPRARLGPHQRHFFQLENVDRAYTHVRVTIYPDGGLKRLRLYGRRVDDPVSAMDMGSETGTLNGLDETNKDPLGPIAPALPLTPGAFTPFGQVIQAWASKSATPKEIKVTPANQGTAQKFHKLTSLTSSYDASSGATTGISVYRCTPTDAKLGQLWPVTLLERHKFTNQAFVPMGAGKTFEEDDNGLSAAGRAYLVVVALNGDDDKPNLQTLRAFVAHSGQGIMYNAGVWHHPMVVLENTMDFSCVETQIGDGSLADCEIVELKEKKQLVRIPFF